MKGEGRWCGCLNAKATDIFIFFVELLIYDISILKNNFKVCVILLFKDGGSRDNECF